jgi:hypothetical protein
VSFERTLFAVSRRCQPSGPAADNTATGNNALGANTSGTDNDARVAALYQNTPIREQVLARRWRIL